MNTPNDSALVQFSPESLWVLNFALAFLMFATSLFIERRDLDVLRTRPRSVLVGVGSQWLLLPALTVALILLLRPPPDMALGMLLVAACPGGNASNYLCLLARGNIVLSVGLTAISTLGAAVMTPLLFMAGASAVSRGAGLQPLTVDPLSMLLAALLIIALPLALGLLFRRRWPAQAQRWRKHLRTVAGLVLLAFIIAALLGNLGALQAHVGGLAWMIVLHNGLALAAGYAAAALAQLPLAERRTISLETGIQNSGLALVLIFNFFDGNAGMALVAAGWGLWHLVSGGALALHWSRRRAKVAVPTEPEHG
jgi:bile acid:Na+ symporter, BASS family